MSSILLRDNLLPSLNSTPAHTRLLIATIVIFAIVLSESLWAFTGYLFIAMLLWKRSPMPFRIGLKRLMLIDSLILLTIMPLPFTFIDQNIIEWGGLTLSETGLNTALQIFIKATLSSLIMMTQCYAMSELELSRALFTLRIPRRFILLLQFSIRYISVMQQEQAKLKLAMRARGFGLNRKLHNWKSYGYLFGMLFIKALDRADRIWFAMKCRGYNGHFPVTNNTIKPTLVDKTAIIYLLTTGIIFLFDLFNLLPK